MLKGFLLADLDVGDLLGEARPAALELGKGFAARLHDAQDLERGDEAVARGGVVAEDEVAALLAAEVVAALEHLIDDVLVADAGVNRLAARRLHGGTEAGVAHDGGDERLLGERALRDHVQRGDGHDVVAVQKAAGLVAEDDAVGIAIVRDAEVGAVFANFGAEVLRMHGAAVAVDVGAVGGVAEDEDFRAQFAQDAGGGLVGGAVGAVHHDAHAVEGQALGERSLCELDVTAQRVVNADGFADLRGGGADALDVAAEDEAFDPRLDGFGQLEAVRAEELDAVIIVGIVRGGDDDAGVRAQRARGVSDARGGQRADEEHVHAHAEDAGAEGVLEHVAGEAGVLADDDAVLAARAGLGLEVLEDVRGGAAELQGGLGGDRLDVGGATDAVGAEDFLGCVAHIRGLRA